MTTKQIELTNTAIVNLAHYPGEKELTHVLTLHAPLSLELADHLRCRNMVFNLNDIPNDFASNIGLKHELGDIEINIEGYLGTLKPSKIWKFRVTRDTELKLGLDFRAHFRGDEEMSILVDIAKHFNKDRFTLIIGALQGELFPVHDGSGTRVDMSATNAESVEEPEESEDDGEAQGSLASAVSMAGNSAELRKKRGQRTLAAVAPEDTVQ